jgi:hypothetical protein
MRFVLFTLMSVLCAAAFSATVYKWVDEDGVTHFSDQPHENAQKVQVAAPQTFKSLPVRSSGRSESQSAQRNIYSTCAVVSPGKDETFPNTYSVTAAVKVDPQPHDGDQVVLLLDGAPVPGFPRVGGQMTITDLDRGTHTLQAVVQDLNGKPVCQSSSVTFTLLQPSLQNPANPNFKH